MKKAVILASVCLLLACGVFLMPRKPRKVFPSGTIVPIGEILPADSRGVFDGGAVTIYSLKGDDGGHEGESNFHGYKILGAANLSESSAQELRAAFYENAAKKAMSASCFFPHHGIRAEWNGKRVDLVICFQCGQIYSYFDGRETRSPFSAEGRAAFDALYKRAGLTLDTWPP